MRAVKANLLVVPSAFVFLLRAEQTIATRELTRLSLYKFSNCGSRHPPARLSIPHYVVYYLIRRFAHTGSSELLNDPGL